MATKRSAKTAAPSDDEESVMTEAPSEAEESVMTEAPSEAEESVMTATARPADGFVIVTLAKDCRWTTVQAAGITFGPSPVRLPVNDARLPEVRGCDLLTVTEER